MKQKEISIFKISNAEASYESGNLHVRLFYPRNIKEETKRIPENLPFGIKTLESLLKGNFTEIADANNPIKPADGGSMYVFKDNAFLVHRRDMGAPMHKFYHGAPGGYTDSLDSTFSEQGLLETGLRETAEESLLITKDIPHRLIVPKDSKEYTLMAAKNLGLDLKPVYADVTSLSSEDNLQVFYEDGEHIFTSKGRGFLDLMWEGSTSFTLMQIRMLPFSSEEVIPIDAEGMAKDGKWIHFNRESYMLKFSDVENKSFGTPLENPRVSQTKIKEGIPSVYVPEYKEPFLGPDGIAVSHPHIWAPENHTTVCLDALCIRGYYKKRLDIELWKEKCKLEGKSMIPPQFLA